MNQSYEADDIWMQDCALGRRKAELMSLVPQQDVSIHNSVHMTHIHTGLQHDDRHTQGFDCVSETQFPVCRGIRRFLSFLLCLVS